MIRVVAAWAVLCVLLAAVAIVAGLVLAMNAAWNAIEARAARMTGAGTPP
jgi:hypothetical protein